MLGEDERKVKEKANERKKERNDNSKQLMGFSMTSNWFQQEIDGYFHWICVMDGLTRKGRWMKVGGLTN